MIFKTPSKEKIRKSLRLVDLPPVLTIGEYTTHLHDISCTSLCIFVFLSV
jgi:hypothetical protein